MTPGIAYAALASRVLLMFMASALLRSCNPVVYVWAMQSDHVLDASLG